MTDGPDSSQREVTRCGCHGSARVAPFSSELRDACGGPHYGGSTNCSTNLLASQANCEPISATGL